jgi:hypothetical protein
LRIEGIGGELDLAVGADKLDADGWVCLLRGLARRQLVFQLAHLASYCVPHMIFKNKLLNRPNRFAAYSHHSQPAAPALLLPVGSAAVPATEISSFGLGRILAVLIITSYYKFSSITRIIIIIKL